MSWIQPGDNFSDLAAFFQQQRAEQLAAPGLSASAGMPAAGRKRSCFAPSVSSMPATQPGTAGQKQAFLQKHVAGVSRHKASFRCTATDSHLGSPFSLSGAYSRCLCSRDVAGMKSCTAFLVRLQAQPQEKQLRKSRNQPPSLVVKEEWCENPG